MAEEIEKAFKGSKVEIHLREQHGITEWPLDPNHVGHIRVPIPGNREEAEKLEGVIRAIRDLGVKVGAFDTHVPNIAHWKIIRTTGRNGPDPKFIEIAKLAIKHLPEREEELE